MTDSGEFQVRRLGAREVFGEKRDRSSDKSLDELLGRSSVLVFAATEGGGAVGGLTAHLLPMTAYEGAEVFIYDVAVADEYQRRGVPCAESVRAAGRVASLVVPDPPLVVTDPPWAESRDRGRTARCSLMASLAATETLSISRKG